MNHAVSAAREHRVRIADADQFHGLADSLTAGGAGREAREVGTEQLEALGEVAGGRVHFEFALALLAEFASGLFEKNRWVDFARTVGSSGGDRGDQMKEVVLAFAVAQVDAEARAVD